MMGIYVRNSNCGLMLMKSSSAESNEITIATFQSNLSNDQIYGTDDNIIGDIQVKYIRTSNDRLTDSPSCNKPSKIH